jgi:hypothetical protein
LDGIQGAGNIGGSGLVGIGGPYVSDQSSGVGVLGIGGPPNPLSQVSKPAGVGVKGIAGGTADGVVGISNAQSKSGLFGFNTKQQGTGYGVFGRCDATAPSIHDRLTSTRDVRCAKSGHSLTVWRDGACCRNVPLREWSRKNAEGVLFREKARPMVSTVWDEEGGAPAGQWPYEIGDLLELERRVLECLGAALVSEWSNLPTDGQRKLFEHATSGKLRDAALLKTRIARFLHDHKDFDSR